MQMGKRFGSRELHIYGKVKKETGEKNFIPFLYQGQYKDVETGLCYNRFRYYFIHEGMYVGQQDPIGLGSGEYNLYAYVQDTNKLVDMLGLGPLDGITTFYHAGDISGPINPSAGRPNLDFNPAGQGGFYITEDLAQAQKWAERKGVGITKFDIPNSELADLKTKAFGAADGEWADFVTKGREGALLHEFDAVTGPMLANPNKGAPKGIGSQMAIFSDDAAKLFDKYKTPIICRG